MRNLWESIPSIREAKRPSRRLEGEKEARFIEEAVDNDVADALTAETEVFGGATFLETIVGDGVLLWEK